MSIKILTLKEAKVTKARCEKYGEVYEEEIGKAAIDYRCDNSDELIAKGTECAVVMVLPSKDHPNYEHQKGMLKTYLVSEEENSKSALYFNIKFDELSITKQDELITELLPVIQASAEEEGKEFLKREWHEPKPQSWQEAYCRIYTIDYHNWRDYAEQGAEAPPQFMWETWQEEGIREVAEQKLRKAFSLTEIEVRYD